jgi:hypothetical protein
MAKNDTNKEKIKEAPAGAVKETVLSDATTRIIEGSKKDASPEMVEVPKETLEKVMATVAEQQKQINILTEAADKGRLSFIQQRRDAGKLVKTAKLTTLNGDVVVGWKILEDDVRFESGRLIEKQTVKIFFKGGKDIDMGLRAFSVESGKTEGEVIKESKDKDGNVFFTLQLENGDEIEIQDIFLN